MTNVRMTIDVVACVVDVVGAIAAPVFLYVILWQNRASQWTVVGTINEIVYRQHKKYPKRRTWVHETKRLSEREVRWTWLQNKVDTLD